jgi:hypothetical protein
LKNVNLFNIHEEYFMGISDIVWTFGKFCVYFPGFGIMYEENSGNPVLTQIVTSPKTKNTFQVLPRNVSAPQLKIFCFDNKIE